MSDKVRAVGSVPKGNGYVPTDRIGWWATPVNTKLVQLWTSTFVGEPDIWVVVPRVNDNPPTPIEN